MEIKIKDSDKIEYENNIKLQILKPVRKFWNIEK